MYYNFCTIYIYIDICLIVYSKRYFSRIKVHFIIGFLYIHFSEKYQHKLINETKRFRKVMTRTHTIHSMLQSANLTEQVFKHHFPPKYFEKKSWLFVKNIQNA